jgi:uncharacterized protein YlxW (UPF0749 family)
MSVHPVHRHALHTIFLQNIFFSLACSFVLLFHQNMGNKVKRKRKNAKWNKEEAEMRRQDVEEAKRLYMRKKQERKRTK